MAAYCQPLIVQDYISLSTVDGYILLNISFQKERYGELEGAGWLPGMLPLRDDILRGDYRALYLSWLKTLEVEDLLDLVQEPPVPPRLKQITPALSAFVEFFDIDRALIQVASEASPRLDGPPPDWLARAIAGLPGEERDAFLLRLAQDELHLSAAPNRRLRHLAPPPQPELTPRRTVGQLLRDAKDRRGTALPRPFQAES